MRPNPLHPAARSTPASLAAALVSAIVCLLVAGPAVAAAADAGAASGAGATPAADAPVFHPPAKGKFKLFLLVGQSNMAGRGKVEEQDRKPHPRVWTLDKAGRWVPAVDPIHFDKPTVAGVGLGTSFGRTVADANPDDMIGLIPCAVGGTSIDQWSSAAAKGLYADAVARAKVAMKDGTLVGILWHQGEADAKKADAYPAKAVKLFADFRRDLDAADVPVVLGTIGDFNPQHEPINVALQAATKAVPHAALADAAGLTDRGDKLHFDSASCREFGRRYAAKWRELVAAKPIGATPSR